MINCDSKSESNNIEYNISYIAAILKKLPSTYYCIIVCIAKSMLYCFIYSYSAEYAKHYTAFSCTYVAIIVSIQPVRVRHQIDVEDYEVLLCVFFFCAFCAFILFQPLGIIACIFTGLVSE